MNERNEDYAAIAMSWVNMAVAMGCPDLVPFVGIANPLIQRVFSRVFSIFDSWGLSNVSKARLGVAYVNAAEAISKNHSLGKTIDKSFHSTADIVKYTKADEIIEAVLWNVFLDSESEKSSLYGRFSGNVPYVHDLSYAQFTELNSILKQLTYTEIRLLEKFKDGRTIYFKDLEGRVYSDNHSDECFLFGNLHHLKNLGLLIQCPPFFLGASIGRVRITSLGENLLNCIG